MGMPMNCGIFGIFPKESDAMRLRSVWYNILRACYSPVATLYSHHKEINEDSDTEQEYCIGSCPNFFWDSMPPLTSCRVPLSRSWNRHSFSSTSR